MQYIFLVHFFSTLCRLHVVQVSHLRFQFIVLENLIESPFRWFLCVVLSVRSSPAFMLSPRRSAVPVEKVLDGEQSGGRQQIHQKQHETDEDQQVARLSVCSLLLFAVRRGLFGRVLRCRRSVLLFALRGDRCLF